MKRLYLLRHAEAAPAQGYADFERKLTARGQSQASALGEKMRAKGYIPAFVYCSAAVRTRQTLEGLALNTKTEFSEKIYSGGIGELLALLEKDVPSLLIVAHNPSIYELAARLSGNDDRLQSGYRPATLSVIDYTGKKNTLIDLLNPDDF